MTAYFNSADFSKCCPLTTRQRPKTVCHQADLEILLEENYKDETHFHTTHGKVQNAYLMLLESLSLGRPGEFVTSTAAGYYHSNSGLKYDAHRVWIIPNNNNAHAPRILLMIRVRDLKGHIGDESCFKQLVFYAEPNSSQAFCLVRLFLTLCLMDGVFEDMGTIEEIVQLKQPCTQTHALNYKLNWTGQNVL